MSNEDRKWWNAEEAVFSSETSGGGLPTGPTFDLIVYEAINFMDGKRTTSDIAGLLSAEYNHDFDAAWMDQLVGVLGRLQLVSAVRRDRAMMAVLKRTSKLSRKLLIPHLQKAFAVRKRRMNW